MLVFCPHSVRLIALLLPFLLCDDAVAGSLRHPTARGLGLGDEPDQKADSSKTGIFETLVEDWIASTNTDSENDDDDGSLSDSMTTFETAVHSPAVFGVDVDAAVDLADVFTPAASLDVFKSIDPDKFTWMNPDNIEAGATTCGFLRPTLGAEPGVNYPVIDVYMCVQFATNQPAPNGNLVVHCGGPGSLSNCVGNMGSADKIGEENAANYNIISIDQRGMGRSMPSFYHEECVASRDGLDPGEDGKINATGLQMYLDGLKEYVASCWGCSDCGFQYDNVDQPDGTVRSFHFLEYSGTRQLAEDLDRFRVLVEAPQLSLYGISYGTGVMGMYATVFPSNVDKFILDGSQSPYNAVDFVAKLWGVGYSFRYNYLKYTCWAANAKIPGSCPVEPEDLVDCISKTELLMNVILSDYYGGESVDDDTVAYFLDLNSDKDVEIYNIALNVKTPIDFLLQLLTNYPAAMKKTCATDKDSLASILADIDSAKKKRSVGLNKPDCNTYDQPSDTNAPICFDGVPDVKVDFLVNGQDQAGGVSAYNDDVFISQVLEFQKQYGHEYIDPVQIYAAEGLSVNYYWPKNIPLPILGNPNVSGMISGQLYDPNTPYIQTSQMREHFPSTSALTSQAISHGLDGGPDGPCQRYIVNYLASGVIDWTDSTVCGDDFPYFHDGISRK